MDALDMLRYLRCPVCVQKLSIVGEGQTVDTVTGVVICLNGHKFSIHNGVPDFRLPGADTTQDTFDYKWGHFSEYGWDPATEKQRYEWYLQRYGWTDKTLREFIGKQKLILDAGTGLGSQVAMYAGMTKGLVFGVDISESVRRARARLEKSPNTYFVQADIHHLPFKPGIFDFVASDQVLHHCPNTEAAFKALVPFVKPGGQIAFYVYKRKSDVREACDDLLRETTTKMTPDDCLKFAEAATLFGRSLSKLDLEFQRRVYWGMFKCFWNDDFDYRTNVMVNFDWYHPKFAWRHTPEEVKQWVDEAGLDILVMDVGDAGISVRAAKPA